MTQRTFVKILITFVFVCIFVSAYVFNIQEYLTLTALKDSLTALTGFVSAHPVLAAAAFIAVYTFAASFSIPGATVLTVTSGALFGPVMGTLVTNVGATLGATLVFMAGRFMFGSALQTKYAKQLSTFNAEIQKQGVWYMLTLRLIPLFPFFLVNILASVTSLRLRSFIWTTSLGILPGSFVYALAGSELVNITTIHDILSPGVIRAFVLLAAFSLVPVLYNKYKKRSE